MLTLLKKALPRNISNYLQKKPANSVTDEIAAPINDLSIETVSSNFPINQLDHLIHALKMNGRLASLSSEQIDNIMFALRGAGLLNRHPDIYNCTYNEDGFVSFHNCDFLQDPLFLASYKLGRDTLSWGGDIRWRAYVVCWAANQVKNLPGDFVECGVNRGGYSRALMNYINFKNYPQKKFYLLDTYYGFPADQREFAVKDHLNKYKECYDDVVKTFKEFDNAIVVRGKIPDTLTQVPSKEICYLSIDMNCAEPEIEAAEYFWDKMVPGGIIVLDDYAGGEVYSRQKEAFDNFAKRKGIQILTMPTGQGIILKN